MTHTNSRPGLLRQLMVIIYDLLLLISTLFLATVVPVVLNQGQAIQPGNPLFLFYLLMVSLFFYGWFWTHGGQTLGMRAWKVFLVPNDQDQVSWKQAGIRFCVAIFSWLLFGLGFLWQWIGSEKQSWHDVISRTHLVVRKQEKS
jgi:uncharacterized RDD family membrane protein YckC